MGINRNLLNSLAPFVVDACDAEMSVLYPESDDRSEILVSVRPDDYSASVISRAVEDCDVHLVNMNVTSARMPDGALIVALRVDCSNPSIVERSLERYGLCVIDSWGAMTTIDNEEERRRAAEVLHILEL